MTKSKTLTPNKEFVPPTPERENVEPVIVTNRISELPANNKKGENKQKKSREVTKSKTITPEKEFVPPTPERENVIPVIVIDDHATLHSMSTKKRLNLINSTSKKLQKLKNANNIDNGMKISHPQNKLKTTECLEVKDTILVEKTEEKKQSTKRLSLSKPLKRKCSFSGKDDQKKLTLVQNAVKVVCHFNFFFLTRNIFTAGQTGISLPPRVLRNDVPFTTLQLYAMYYAHRMPYFNRNLKKSWNYQMQETLKLLCYLY